MRNCAWCQPKKDLTPATHAVSHGICSDCLQTQLAKLSPLPVATPDALFPPQPVPAGLTAHAA